MNRKNLSLITCGLLLSVSSAFAESALTKAIKAGTTSGDVSVYHEKTSQDDSANADSGFTAGTIGLSYETGSFNGFTAKTSFRAGHEFAEKEEGDYEGDFVKDSIINEIFIKYSNESYSLAVGRQEIDLEWIGDFNEAVIGEVTTLENTIITAGYSHRQAVAGVDEIGEFTELQDSNSKNINGVYLLDVKYEGIEGLELNPYYYSASDLANYYGFKATYSNDTFGILGHYAASDEDVTGVKDGSIYQIELSATLGPVNLAVGHIATDKDGNVGSMSTFGDNIDPTEEIGDQVYGDDAETNYGTIGGSISGVDLSLLYASAEYLVGTDKKDIDEVSFFVDYAFTDELALSVAFSDVDGETKADDFDKVSATLTYSF